MFSERRQDGAFVARLLEERSEFGEAAQRRAASPAGSVRLLANLEASHVVLADRMRVVAHQAVAARAAGVDDHGACCEAVRRAEEAGWSGRLGLTGLPGLSCPGRVGRGDGADGKGCGQRSSNDRAEDLADHRRVLLGPAVFERYAECGASVFV